MAGVILVKYVIGIDLGTSAVKAILIDQSGNMVMETSAAYPLIQEKTGYSEQDPEDWIKQTKKVLKRVTKQFTGNVEDIEGVSFSGQMHGLVMLDENNQVLKNAILWNDTRTKSQCDYITKLLGDKIIEITKNKVLEGFTLPKILWVKENEPQIYEKLRVFLLPKDYVRYRMTGKIHTDYSDAAGTSLLHIEEKKWSKEICDLFHIDESICPPLVESHSFVGTILPEFADKVGLSQNTKVFAGGADNACGAVGAGILSTNYQLSSIGTSGVILAYEESIDEKADGKVHFFNHAKSDAFYSMGVTLSAGLSLSWFKNNFFKDTSFPKMIDGIKDIPIGSDGLLFAPFLVGERTPYSDAFIRGSFIGVSALHTKTHFVRAVMEGITFSLNESIHLLREKGKEIGTIVSIGGGAKNDLWLQMQADIFHTRVVSLKSEQGPGLGAALIAAYGCKWFATLEEGAEKCIQIKSEFHPIEENVQKYKQLFNIYQTVYDHTKKISHQLLEFRDSE